MAFRQETERGFTVEIVSKRAGNDFAVAAGLPTASDNSPQAVSGIDMQPPWARTPLNPTPTQFERMVVHYLRDLDVGVRDFEVRHQATISGPDGEYIMDAVATFTVAGAEFAILIECKHHKDPIKRELVQVLADKVRSVRAQKGMLFSTAPFQKGAVEYARSQKIALVHCTEGGPIYETRSRYGPVGPTRPYDAHIVTLSSEGHVIYRGPSQSYLLEAMFGTSNETGEEPR